MGVKGSMRATEDVMRAQGYLSAREVCGKTGWSHASIYRKAEEGAFKVLKFPEQVMQGERQHWYVELASLVAYLGPQTATVMGLATPTTQDTAKPA